MGTAEMVGAMGLTFFCNRCVETFYKFRKEPVAPEELKDVCGEAISAFESLKWPSEGQQHRGERVALFNTNEEVKVFATVVEPGNAAKVIEGLIEDLKSITDKNKQLEERKRTAEKLQKFFDNLGNYSFYATRDCIRTAGTMAGI